MVEQAGTSFLSFFEAVLALIRLTDLLLLHQVVLILPPILVEILVKSVLAFSFSFFSSSH